MVQEKNADELFQNFVWHTMSLMRGRIRTRCCPLIRARRRMTVRLVRESSLMTDIILTTWSYMQLFDTYAPSSPSSSPTPRFASSYSTSPSSAATTLPAVRPKPLNVSARTQKLSPVLMIPRPRTHSSPRADVRPAPAKHPCLMRKCPGPDIRWLSAPRTIWVRGLL